MATINWTHGCGLVTDDDAATTKLDTNNAGTAASTTGLNAASLHTVRIPVSTPSRIGGAPVSASKSFLRFRTIGIPGHASILHIELYDGEVPMTVAYAGPPLVSVPYTTHVSTFSSGPIPVKHGIVFVITLGFVAPLPGHVEIVGAGVEFET
jgi:hypothetical protein